MSIAKSQILMQLSSFLSGRPAAAMYESAIVLIFSIWYLSHRTSNFENRLLRIDTSCSAERCEENWVKLTISRNRTDTESYDSAMFLLDILRRSAKGSGKLLELRCSARVCCSDLPL